MACHLDREETKSHKWFVFGKQVAEWHMQAQRMEAEKDTGTKSHTNAPAHGECPNNVWEEGWGKAQQRPSTKMNHTETATNGTAQGGKEVGWGKGGWQLQRMFTAQCRKEKATTGKSKVLEERKYICWGGMLHTYEGEK